uniref:MULE transposase domain-containing protein n=1 Tax=Lactuca sativa TaxID=4236 RepID=A0A9R1UJN0_LACSA|nr:hypothetical protein LSAT_V11C900457930 [Lactuca sativa]
MMWLMDINCGVCTFRLWASWMSDAESFQIKSLKVDHNYARNFKLGSLVTYLWIGSHYIKEIVQSHKLSVRKLSAKVITKFGIQVSMGQCKRAKKYAVNLIKGSLVEHYGKLWAYGHEILRTNPRSTAKLDVETGPDGKKYLSKFYMCFQRVKQGWKEGCRRIIGLDDYFLKGIYKGELLCTVGRDANDQIYHIAWAVVCVENKHNWKWFLDMLIYDMNLNFGNGYSLMLDKHKVSLIEAIKELLPYVEHMQYVRHNFQILQKRFTWVIYHTHFWRASEATIENAFKNGFYESPIVVIVDARKKPIITILEELKLYMMDRLYNMKLEGQQWGNHIFPEIRNKVNLVKKSQKHFLVLPRGLNQFEVRGAAEAYEVDLERKTCSCRL